MKKAFILTALMLAACDGGGETGVSPPPDKAVTAPAPPVEPKLPSPPPAGTPLAQVGDLVGEYRVAGLDGEDFNEEFGMGLSIDGPSMSFEPICAGFIWHIELEEGTLTTRRQVRAEEAPGQGPPPPCAIALHPRQRQLAQILDAATLATRMPSNGILLSGGGRSVLLFSQ